MGRITLYIIAIVLIYALVMLAANATSSEAQPGAHNIYLPLIENAYPTAISGVGPITPTP